MNIRVNNLLLALFLTSILGACDSGSSSSSGGGSEEPVPKPGEIVPNTTEPVVGPNLNGDNWAGYYKSRTGKYDRMTAVIRHVGNRIIIKTTKSGVGGKLSGKIDGIGKMKLYDAYDNEDWTTLYGPASKNSINLADFVFKGNSKADTNIIILKRKPA